MKEHSVTFQDCRVNGVLVDAAEYGMRFGSGLVVLQSQNGKSSPLCVRDWRTAMSPNFGGRVQLCDSEERRRQDLPGQLHGEQLQLCRIGTKMLVPQPTC